MHSKIQRYPSFVLHKEKYCFSMHTMRKCDQFYFYGIGNQICGLVLDNRWSTSELHSQPRVTQFRKALCAT